MDSHVREREQLTANSLSTSTCSSIPDRQIGRQTSVRDTQQLAAGQMHHDCMFDCATTCRHREIC